MKALVMQDAMAEEDELGTLLDEARELLAKQCQITSDLVEDGPAGSAEQDLLGLLERRKVLEQQLGRSLVRWLALGGGVKLVDALAPEVEDPEPEEPEPETVAVLSEPEVVAPEVVVDPVPVTPRPTATKAALQALVSNGLTPNWTDDRKAKSRILRRVFRTLDKPSRLKTKGAVERTVRSMCVVFGRSDELLELPRPVQKQVVGLLASMARYIQDECKQPMDAVSDDFRTLFSAMTRWSAEHRPGFVAGLSRNNKPEWGRLWLDDAKHWWAELHEELEGPGESEGVTPEEALSELEDDLQQEGLDKDLLQRAITSALAAGLGSSDKRLIRMLVPHYELLKGARISKTLKNNVRQAVRAEDTNDEDLEDDAAPISEAVLGLTRGKVAAIAGGDPRQHAQRRIQERFGFSDVLWDPAEPRRIQALLTRIQAGSIDVLFVLRRFIGHTAFSDLCAEGNAAGITVCMIDHGYGVTQLRLALEAKAGG